MAGSYGDLGLASQNAALQAALEDAQASLAAALARLEGYRLREKAVIAENGLLRAELAKKAPQALALGPPPAPAAPGGPPPMSVGPRGGGRPRGPDDGTPVTELPVTLLIGGKRLPGGLLLSPARIDFVELKARVAPPEFVGVTVVRPAPAAGAAGAGSGASGGGFAAAPAPAPPAKQPSCVPCLGSETADEEEFDALPGPSPGGGGARPLSAPGAERGVWTLLWRHGNTAGS